MTTLYGIQLTWKSTYSTMKVAIPLLLVLLAGSMANNNQETATVAQSELADESMSRYLAVNGLNISNPVDLCYLMFVMDPVLITNSSEYCNTTHDTISCWPASKPGLVSVSCPTEFNSLRYDTTENVTRYCYANGTWDKANYSNCQPLYEIYGDFDSEYDGMPSYHLDNVLLIILLGYVISLVALIVAFVIFASYKSLRCVRNNIHWNLISTFILRNVAFLFILKLVGLEVKEKNGWACRILSTAYSYFQETNFFWMLVEGLYLHTVIVMAFGAEKVRFWIYMIIGWCVPCIFTFAWAVVKYMYEDEECWLPPQGASWYDYIYQGPIIIVLLINFIFLFNIVRILITKLRASNTLETKQYRKAVKATVVLLPLLGLTYVLFFMSPDKDNIPARLVFLYFNAILQSTQGLSVSVFYVFLNGEVKSVMRRHFTRWRDSHSLARSRNSRNQSIVSSASRQGLTLNITLNIFRDSKRKYSKESRTEIEVVSQMNSNGTPNGVEPTHV
ncbi:corticotropin-releasing factor receptor 2-like isoform X2 [Ptychodera flava]|uniref:corticotropin-releasing factor receptor 2-like isoform X2 n=1 Tax=Ptychodera flava TaxID=63121 RepID=UPI00396A27B5